MKHLSLALLGTFRVTLDGTPVSHFGYDKVRALLAYLAVENTPHEREALLGLFWAELSQEAARNNLRQVLLRLRETLDDRNAQPPYLLANRATIQWNPQSNYSLDVATFTTLVETCARHVHRNMASCNACAARLSQAVHLYTGDFLAEFFLPDSARFEEWAVLKREALRRSALDSLTHLITYHGRRAEYPQALDYARRKLALDSWNQETHRQLMRLYLLNNERNASLAQYELCRQLLKEGLDVEPEPETLVLYTQIRDMTDDVALPLAPLTAPTRRRHTLPPQLTPFVGREQELAELSSLLDEGESRLIVLTGLGGSGKTRLAVQAATEQIDSFADGIYYVALAYLTNVALLPATIASALGIDVPATADVTTHLLHSMRELEALLVLDNVEQLLSTPASVHTPPSASRQTTLQEFLAQLLNVAPGVTILVTSRQRLNMRTEWIFPIVGLALPEEDTTQPIEASSAAKLFLQSARRAGSFVLAPEEVPSLLRICHLVDGLPLALELAAAWTRVLSCTEIADEIERSLQLFETDLTDVPERHRSLTAVFSYSWNALTTAEQRVLRHLSVFRGGFQRDAATHIAGATLPGLASLVDNSMLRYNQRGRYELYQLIRQYVEEKLAPGEDTLVRHRHADYYLALAERSEPELIGADQVTWVERLESEVNNLRAALNWAIDADEVVLAGRICVALDYFWPSHGHLSEGRGWLEKILVRLQADDSIRSALRARVLNSIGMIACDRGEYMRAIAVYEESLALQRTLNDEAGSARVLNNLGNIYLRQNNGSKALAHFEEALAIYRHLGNAWAISILLSNIGVLLCDQGDFEKGEQFYLESLALCRQQGDANGIAMSLYNLADVLHRRGRDEEAKAYIEESLDIFRRLHNTLAEATILNYLGTKALFAGEPLMALAKLRESLSIFRDLGAQHHLAAVLESFAAVAGMLGQAEKGAQILGAVGELRVQIGAELNPAEQEEYVRIAQLAQGTLDDAAFSSACKVGSALRVDEAIAIALSIPA